ncbi:HD-GYP domain-containing protein [Methylomarinum vadi]|uniref:HD-GYP domain-containing protein n=1 Tax=Methylomarinum vadi TaxID=438855 RepID=UPI0009FD47BC|nr:HD-GYP domain-containing protein [Methylomarinum vadi]
MINDNLDSPGTSIQLTKVGVKDLQIGMYVSKLDRPWLETNFLFQGFELKTAEDIKAVQEQCEFVYIDSARKNKAKVGTARDTPYSKGWLANRVPPQNRKSFEQEIDNAGHVYQQTSSVVRGFMEDVQLGRAINVELAKKAVADCVTSILNHPDALMWMTQLKSRDKYTAQHSMNVCIYAIALGRQINLPVNELHNIGLCGMMHDMGKMRVPLAILNKPDRLTAEELKVMQSHTTLGWKLLMSSSGMYGGAIDVAYTHHEKLDGSGYPRGLSAEQISPYARMVAIADMYDAITSDRVCQNGRTHLDAISIMTKQGDSHLDSGLTIKFIECLGIYPPGSIVEMGNGEVAIVVEVNPKAKIKPKIILLLDEDKKPQPERLVDLSRLDLDASGQPYTIRRIARASEFDFDIEKFYGGGGLRRGLLAA